MIGKELTDLLIKDDIKLADLRYGDDLRNFDECMNLCKDVKVLYHLAGIKGSPKMTKEQPSKFFVPMIQMNTNILEAAKQCGVEKVLYTSSIAVLNPDSDEYPAWAKMTGEKQIEAYKIENSKTKYSIVRPSNVYGKYDNFNRENLMVISDLIKKSLKNDKLIVWGDGSQTRNFINARDVANGMIKTIKYMPDYAVNLGGKEYSIKEVAEKIKKHIGKPLEIVYDKSKKIGKQNRPMNSALAEYYLKWEPKVNLDKGIKEVIKWKQLSG